jgi:glycosyltransferase involved in cell wall biosynthesis
MSTPLVSVVIPCYNHGAYLQEAIDSVEKIPFPDKEIIILDDGSKDEQTLEKVRSLGKSGYQVVFQENKGVAATRNHGISLAKGKYIIPLDADNRLLEPYFTKGVEILESDSSCAVVFGDAIVFGQKETIWPNSPLQLGQILFENYIDNCAIFRKSAWESVGGYDEKAPFHTREDWYFWLDLIEKGWKFIHLPEFSFEYRFLGNSKVRSRFSNPTNRLIIYEYIFPKQKRMIEHFLDSGELERAKGRQILSDLYWQLAYYHLGFGKIGKGYKKLFTSLMLGQNLGKTLKTALVWPIRRLKA